MKNIMKQSLLCFVLLLCGRLWGMEELSLRSIADRLVKERSLEARPLIAEFVTLPVEQGRAIAKGYERAKTDFAEYITKWDALLTEIQTRPITAGHTLWQHKDQFRSKLMNKETNGNNLDNRDLYKSICFISEIYKALEPDLNRIKELEKQFQTSTGLDVEKLVDVKELTPLHYAEALSNPIVELLGEKIAEALIPIAGSVTVRQENKIVLRYYHAQ